MMAAKRMDVSLIAERRLRGLRDLIGRMKAGSDAGRRRAGGRVAIGRQAEEIRFIREPGNTREDRYRDPGGGSRQCRRAAATSDAAVEIVPHRWNGQLT